MNPEKVDRELQERRLSAILAADVVGYSRLMGADEEGTLQALKAHRRAGARPPWSRLCRRPQSCGRWANSSQGRDPVPARLRAQHRCDRSLPDTWLHPASRDAHAGAHPCLDQARRPLSTRPGRSSWPGPLAHVDPLLTTDRRRPPLDLTLGELMQGLRKPPLLNSIGFHNSLLVGEEWAEEVQIVRAGT